MSKLVIVIADDIFTNRLLLSEIIDELGYNHIAVENGREAINALMNNEVDVILMDIEMPVMNGIDATRRAIEKYPDLKVLALTMFNNEEYLESMLDAGAKGFLLKNISKEDLERALQTVMKGNNYYSEELWNYFTKKVIHEEKPQNIADLALTKREIEILQLLLEGFNNKDIAERLFVSERTVIGHKSNLLSKTNCKSTVQLLAYVIKNKLVDF